MRTWNVIAVILLVGSPLAAASWQGKGSYEPDTTLDVTSGWMFTNPDTTATSLKIEKVYLNGFLGECTFPCFLAYTTFNPNVGAVRSSIMPPMTYANALFGVWKDCNKDNVIGLGDQGLIEYRAELLLDTSVCPKQPTPTGKGNTPPLDWFPTHNDGQWVREYLPFSHDAPDVSGLDANPWNINAPGTLLWNDRGTPGQARGTTGSCYLNPQPVGTYRSTGGALLYADCHAGWRVTDTLDSVATGPLSPISFSDAPRDQGHSASLLNQKNPWGTESDASNAQVWDCTQDQPASAPVGNVPNVGNVWVNVSMPKVPPTVSPTGSAAGTTNATVNGFDECDRNTPNDGNRHLGDTAAHAPYTNEGGSPSFAKAGVDGTMGPNNANRRPYVPVNNVLGQATPGDLGFRLATNEGIWTGSNAIGSGGTAGYMTYYGIVDSTAVTKYGLSLPKGATATGKYGVEACGSASSGTVNGWNCDRTKWGSATKVGDSYNLRDVDCYDESIQMLRANGVSWATAFGGPCPYTP